MIDLDAALVAEITEWFRDQGYPVTNRLADFTKQTTGLKMFLKKEIRAVFDADHTAAAVAFKLCWL